MKKFLLIAICASLIALAAGCGKQGSVEADKTAIQAVLDNYITSIENEDMELYSRIFVHDPDMVNFGTAVGERIVGWEALENVIEAQNAALSETKITQSDVTIDLSPEGRFAWATSLWDFKAKMDTLTLDLPVRCTWILEKINKDWEIVHFHKSLGATF